MLILDRASENKLEELVLVSRKLNGVLRENYPGVHKIEPDRKSTRLNSSHTQKSRMPSSA